MTWPSVDAPAGAPADHGEVRTQAYYAGGGDYFVTNLYYFGYATAGAVGTRALALDESCVSPFLVPVRRSFYEISTWVTTAASAGGVLRLGIYASTGGAPGALVVDGGTVASTSTGRKSVTSTQTLDPGRYFLCVAAQVAACTIQTRLAADHTSGFFHNDWGANSLRGWTRLSVSGALPNPYAGSQEFRGSHPSLALRAS